MPGEMAFEIGFVPAFFPVWRREFLFSFNELPTSKLAWHFFPPVAGGGSWRSIESFGMGALRFIYPHHCISGMA
jgi:hypothetical protein